MAGIDARGGTWYCTPRRTYRGVGEYPGMLQYQIVSAMIWYHSRSTLTVSCVRHQQNIIPYKIDLWKFVWIVTAGSWLDTIIQPARLHRLTDRLHSRVQPIVPKVGHDKQWHEKQCSATVMRRCLFETPSVWGVPHPQGSRRRHPRQSTATLHVWQMESAVSTIDWTGSQKHRTNSSINSIHIKAVSIVGHVT